MIPFASTFGEAMRSILSFAALGLALTLGATALGSASNTRADDSVVGDEIDRHVFLPCIRKSYDMIGAYQHHGMSDRFLLSELEKRNEMLKLIGDWRRRVFPLVEGKPFAEREKIYRKLAKECDEP